MPRPPDWLAYLAGLAALLGLCLVRDHVDAPRPPPPVPGAEQTPIAPGAPFASARLVRLAGRPANRGTAFSVSDSGVWLTAARALGHCPRPLLMVADGWAAQARIAAVSGDVAVLTSERGAPALPLLNAATPRAGDDGFIAGFSRGRPGEVAARYVGQEAHLSREAWAEAGRTDGLAGPLFGLAGAPLLNVNGAVIGMALGDAPRLGRLSTAPPPALAGALRAARRAPGAAGPARPVGLDTYGLAADNLRRATSVVAVVCP